MNHTPTFWHYVLYFYFGLRFILHLAKSYYCKQNQNFEKGDAETWIVYFLFWPLFMIIYAVFGVRGTAIRSALYYGLLPWQLYEKKKHYHGSYIRHAISNVGYALKWLLFLESKEDYTFEKKINKNF